MRIFIRIILLAFVLLCIHVNTAGADFMLSGSVTPDPAPLGEPVTFAVTVTNAGTEADTFGVDGCPVQYVIDDLFRPQWGCAEFYRMIVLAPGESITFSPEKGAPQLIHEPSLYPLSPGAHVVAFEIWGVGRTETTFGVLPPDADTAALSGQVLRANGEPAWHTEITLVHEHGDSLDSDGTSTQPPDREYFQTRTGDAGYFFFRGLPPQSYLLRATDQGQLLWYPGVSDPGQAERLLLQPGSYAALQPLLLGSDPPPPPPPNMGVLSGRVFKESPPRPNDPPGLPVPLENAVVAAVALQVDFADSGQVPGPDGDTGEVYPSMREEIHRVVADESGKYALKLPPGVYKVLAGKSSEVLYRYWDNEILWDEAEVVFVSPAAPVTPVDFILPIRTIRADAALTGTVLAYDPVTDGPPQPLAGVQITAWSVLADGPERLLRTVTGEDGMFELHVPPTTPYVVEAQVEGYRTRVPMQDFRSPVAQWADTAPGQTTGNIDFLLQPVGDPRAFAVITGSVYEANPLVDCLPGTDCVLPLAGALVRITPAYPTFAPWERTAITGRDGSFVVRGIPADAEGWLSYYVSASVEGVEPRFHPGGVLFPDAEPLVVFAGQVADAGRIILPGILGDPVGFIPGRVTDPAGHPVVGAVVHGYPDPENPRGPAIPARTDNRGYFTIQNLPLDHGVVVAVESEGYLPTYYPGVHRWARAERVRPAGPNVRMAPLEITLNPNLETGPFIQAGRVRALVDLGPFEDQSAASAILRPERRLALQYHRENIPGAFFFLENTLAMSPVAPVIAGGVAGSNGAVILTGLPQGVYYAFADRPGFETARFGEAPDIGPTPLVLNEMTPTVLADIRLRPVQGGGGPPGDGQRMVSEVLNEPNPFRPQTVIRYRLAETMPVTVQVFDYQGRLVRTLLEVTAQDPGPHQVSWDGTDASGRRSVSGVYFYRVQAGPEATSRKMVLLP